MFARLLALTKDLDAQQVVNSPTTCQAGFTIPSLNNAILFIEIEPAAEGCRGGFWLSTYGLGDQFAEVDAQFSEAYRAALTA